MNGSSPVETPAPARIRIGALELAVELCRRPVDFATRRIAYLFARRTMLRLRRNPVALRRALRRAKRVLVVCHGNIIRSPFAEHLLRQALGPRSSVAIRSAGLEARPGTPPHPTALRTAAMMHVDVSGHSASRVSAECVNASDVILVVDVPQLVAMRRRFPEARQKTFLFTCLAPSTPLEIADPVDADEPVFEACYRHIVQAADPVARLLSEPTSRR